MERYENTLKNALIFIKERETASIPEDDEIEHIFSESFNCKKKSLIKAVGKNSVSSPIIFFKTAIVAVLAICTLCFFSMMASPQIRAAVHSVIYEWQEKFSVFEFFSAESENTDFTSVEQVQITYVPDGFEKYDEFTNDGTRYYCYAGENADFSVRIFDNRGSTAFVQNDNGNYEETEINGRKAYIIYSDEEQCGTIMLTGSQISVTVNGSIGKDELINIAQGIK